MILTIHSRGTAIVPMSVPLTQALGTMESPSFLIKSTSTDKELRFFGADEYVFSVELKSVALHAVREVYCPLGASEFAELFSRLATYERPWTGVEECTSLEQDFSLSVCCSALGIVTFSVSILGLSGVPEEWKVTCNLTSELGQLTGISANANQFFGAVAGT